MPPFKRTVENIFIYIHCLRLVPPKLEFGSWHNIKHATTNCVSSRPSHPYGVREFTKMSKKTNGVAWIKKFKLYWYILHPVKQKCTTSQKVLFSDTHIQCRNKFWVHYIEFIDFDDFSRELNFFRVFLEWEYLNFSEF